MHVLDLDDEDNGGTGTVHFVVGFDHNTVRVAVLETCYHVSHHILFASLVIFATQVPSQQEWPRAADGDCRGGARPHTVDQGCLKSQLDLIVRSGAQIWSAAVGL